MRTLLLALFLIASPVSAQELPGHMNHAQTNKRHWYPSECCHENDCAPATRVERVDDGKFHGRWVTSKHGRVWVPDTKEAHFTTRAVTDKEGKVIENGNGTLKTEKVYTVPPKGDEGLHICMRAFNPSGDKDELVDPVAPMHVLCVIQEPQG